MRKAAYLAVFPCLLAPAIGAQSTVVDAKLLGVNEALVQFCAKASPSAGAALQDRLAKVVGGASPEAQARARATDTYRRAYDEEVRFMGMIDERNVGKICPLPAPAKK